MTGKKLIGMVMIFFALTPGIALSAVTKIDAKLALMIQKGADLSSAKREGILKSVPHVSEPLVATLIRFQGDLSGVEALGARVRSVLGDIATVDVPLSAVNSIAGLQNVVYMEAAKKVRHRMDLSIPATGATGLRGGTPPNWTGNTGRGVIIGIVDTGIDLNHSDFKDASGKTRILYLWDQGAIVGTPPTEFFFTYGNECTQHMIDIHSCPQFDTWGHGTHVAGIAAGNGSATGNGQASYRYVGMAPEADLIVVNSLNSFGTSNSAEILDGIAYIQAKAKALGKPSVINLSLGSDLGPHDGTSNYERALDNASGAGKVIVGAAGNEQAANIHARGSVSLGPPTTVDFGLVDYDDTEEVIDIWYPGADQMSISVAGPCGGTFLVNPGESLSTSMKCGTVDIATMAIDLNNGDHEIVVIIQQIIDPLTAVGNLVPWQFTLYGNSITNGRFDAWAESALGSFFSVVFDPSVSDPSTTLIDSGSATKPISVAAYNTKNSWNSLEGPESDPSISVGDIASFSSLGPRRPCSIISNCPMVQKPEIAAPGNRIMSSLSAQFNPFTLADIDPDGVHITAEGTSMAAPHVTGAVALLLQAAPNLTSDQIKTLLTSAAAADAFTGAVPNDTWGYGKLSVAAAYAAIPNPLDAPPAGLWATPGQNSVTLGWLANTEPNLAGYRLYRNGATGGYAQIASFPTGVLTYQDTGLKTGTTYTYMLRAINSAGAESLDSKTVSASLAAPPVTPAGKSGGCVMIPSVDADFMLPVVVGLIVACLLWRRIGASLAK